MLARTRTIVACATAALSLASGGPAAFATTAATTTWTVTPGGSFTASPGTISFADITHSGGTTCTMTSLSGTLKSGSGLPGRHIGSVNSISATRCSPSVIFGNNGVLTGLNWHLNAGSYNATTGVTSGKLIGFHVGFIVPMLNCSATIDGTSDTANNGTIPFKYNNTTHVVKFVKGGNLHIYDSNCTLSLVNGDQMVVTGSATVSPSQTITGP